MTLNAVLVVQLCDQSVKEGEIERVASVARAQGAIFQHIPLTSDRMEHLVAVCSRQLFDMVYICGHGKEDENKTVKSLTGQVCGDPVEVTFPQLASLLCDNLSPSATVMLSCCDSGHRDIATDMMAVCGSMNWVFGVPQDSTNSQLDAVFNPLLFQLANGENPGTAKTVAERNGRVQFSAHRGLSEFSFHAYRRANEDIEIEDGIDVISADEIGAALDALDDRYQDFSHLRFRVGEMFLDGFEDAVDAEIDHLGDFLPLAGSPVADHV